MEKKAIKPAVSKKTSFCNNDKLQNMDLEDTNTEIRLGISLADEKAKQESTKRKLEAPLTIEEKIFLGKL